MCSPTRRLDARSERGQTMVEFALVVPVLVLILFAIVQFGVAFKDYVTLTDAARVGARKAAVSRLDPNPIGATTQAVKSAAVGLDESKLVVAVTPGTPWSHGNDVTVHATYPYTIDLFGFVLAKGDLKSTTTERVE